MGKPLRVGVQFSYSAGKDPDADLVIAELERVPKRQRSASLWSWAAGYLRGQAREVEQPAISSSEIDELDALLDEL